MMTSTQPEVGKSSLKRVSRLKSLLAKAKSPVPTEQTSDAYPICQTDEDSQTDLDSQRMSMPDAPMVVSEDKPCACASQLSDCAGVDTNYVHMGTVLILTNDERMKMRLLLLITSRSFSCLIVNSLAEAQASMEREKFSAALLYL